MRIAWSAWGFIGDGLIDSPDGGRLGRALLIEYLTMLDLTMIGFWMGSILVLVIGNK
jgi:hypothetical protein